MKPVITNTPDEIVDSSVKFDNKKFDGLVFDKGYDVYVDKALRCPCIVTGTGQALSNCKNCLGNGWLFINRSETRVVIQGMRMNKKYEDWSETTTGFAKLTARAIDKVSFMDRITIKDAETIFTEVLKPEVFQNKLIAYPIYPVLSIEYIALFEGVNVPLKILEEGTDYTLVDEKIQFADSYKILIAPSVTIRYIHNLVYHVIEMNRDVMKTRIGTNKCNGGNDDGTANMPIFGIIRKAHYIFDKLKFEENTLIENSQT